MYDPSETVPTIAVDVLYFAVYPDGRRCEVTRTDVELFGAVWKEKDNVKIETDIVQKYMPVYGKMNFKPL